MTRAGMLFSIGFLIQFYACARDAVYLGEGDDSPDAATVIVETGTGGASAAGGAHHAGGRLLGGDAGESLGTGGHLHQLGTGGSTLPSGDAGTGGTDSCGNAPVWFESGASIKLLYYGGMRPDCGLSEDAYEFSRVTRTLRYKGCDYEYERALDLDIALNDDELASITQSLENLQTSCLDSACAPDMGYLQLEIRDAAGSLQGMYTRDVCPSAKDIARLSDATITPLSNKLNAIVDAHCGDSDSGSCGYAGIRQYAGSPSNACPLIPPSNVGVPAGDCPLVGRWTLNGSHGVVQSTGVIEFTADGAYYGGPVGTDISRTYGYDGAYSVTGSTFKLLFSCGDGCNGSGSFDLQFQSNCAVAILNELTTECTGNRNVVAGKVVLTRH